MWRQRLEAAIREVERQGASLAPPAQQVSAGFGPLAPHGTGVQEWIGAADKAFPALGVFTHLAACAQAAGEARGRDLIVWLGRWCWPYPHRLPPRVRQRSLFVDASSDADRLWAVDLVARSPAVAAVVADGRGLNMAATRRLQLAVRAERGGRGGRGREGREDQGVCVLLARAAGEEHTLSASAVRWRVRPVESPTCRPRWSVQLLRCKGVQPAIVPMATGHEWVLEEDDAAGVVVVAADVADRSAAQAVESRRIA